MIDPSVDYLKCSCWVLLLNVSFMRLNADLEGVAQMIRCLNHPALRFQSHLSLIFINSYTDEVYVNIEDITE